MQNSLEDIQDDNLSKPTLINKTTKLAKKRILRSQEQKNIINDENNIDNEEVPIIRNEVIHVSSNQHQSLNQKENNASFLIKIIIKKYYLSIWKRKVKALKYYSRAYNPKRTNFKKLINQISSAIKQHKFEYFNEIVENMSSLPVPENVKHNVNYGSIRIIDKDILSKKYTDKISSWAQNNYDKKTNGFKLYLIESLKKMSQNKELYGLQGSRETDYSNYAVYQDNKSSKTNIGIGNDYSNINESNYNNKENISINIKEEISNSNEKQ